MPPCALRRRRGREALAQVAVRVCCGAYAVRVPKVVDLEEDLLCFSAVRYVAHEVCQRLAYGPEQPVGIAVGEARHAGAGAVHAEEVLHSRVAADAVVLLHIATAQRGALGEPANAWHVCVCTCVCMCACACACDVLHVLICACAYVCEYPTQLKPSLSCASLRMLAAKTSTLSFIVMR